LIPIKPDKIITNVEIISRLKRLRKLPSSNDESKLQFLTENLDLFNNLSSVQSQFILATIDAELETSKSFGLTLTDEEQYREKFAFLSLFNSRIDYIKEYSQLTGLEANSAYNKTHSLLFEELSNMLSDILIKYYAFFSEQGNLEVKNKYNAHLESTLSIILRSLWG